jgi:hypothetical protein
MSPGELTKVSDNDVCRSGTEKNPAVLAERQKRELGDCNPDHLYCHSLGLKPGTDLYVQCRLQARQIGAQQAAAQQAGYAAMTKQGAAMMAPPPVTNTNCNTFGNTINCRSTTQP